MDHLEYAAGDRKEARRVWAISEAIRQGVGDVIEQARKIETFAKGEEEAVATFFPSSKPGAVIMFSGIPIEDIQGFVDRWKAENGAQDDR